MLDRIARTCSDIERWSGLPGKFAGWLVPILVVVVCASVLAAHLRVSTFFTLDAPAPLIGGAFSASTLTDLQWHLFAILIMLGGAFALHGNRHVQVDFLSARFSARIARVIILLGDLLIMLPFCGFMIWFGGKFAVTAYHLGEGSVYGGMTDRWMIKMFLPLGFALIAVNGVARSLRLIIELVQPSAAAAPKGNAHHG